MAEWGLGLRRERVTNPQSQKKSMTENSMGSREASFSRYRIHSMPPKQNTKPTKFVSPDHVKNVSKALVAVAADHQATKAAIANVLKISPEKFEMEVQEAAVDQSAKRQTEGVTDGKFMLGFVEQKTDNDEKARQRLANSEDFGADSNLMEARAAIKRHTKTKEELESKESKGTLSKGEKEKLDKVNLALKKAFAQAKGAELMMVTKGGKKPDVLDAENNIKPLVFPG